MTEPLPFCTIIIPCRDEAGFIRQCLDSVVATTYPKDRLELLVVDGRSADGTREIIAEYERKFPFVRMVDNPRQITPTALNAGVRAARGTVIMRMDAHAEYPRDYVEACVGHLLRSGADNVGGIMRTVARSPSLMGQAIISVLSHRMGVGNSAFRTGAREPIWADTVFGGCYRRDVFDRVGLWNENLLRGQDMEFNLRLGRAGGRILLVPDIECSYIARSDLPGFIRHNFINGLWAIVPFAYSSVVPVRLRHLAPAALVLALLTGILLTPLIPQAIWVTLALAAVYGVGVLAASVELTVSTRRPGMLAVLPFVFASLHIPYGLGSLWGLVRLPWLMLFSHRQPIPGRP